MPTLLDLLGFVNPEADALPGESFAPVLRGGSLNREDSAVVIGDEYGPNRMLRTPDWKYVRRFPDGPNELYHLAVDPGEKQNRVDQPEYRAVQAAMREHLDAWFDRYVIPDLDGARLTACQGKGQTGLVHGCASGEGLFNPVNR
jgi:arylsulfatase A-like enzyme